MFSDVRKRELMQLAIDEAKRSVAEDQRVHPKVGAVLADADGNVLYTAHRGENGNGEHAEYTLFKKVQTLAADVAGCHLFVTLEPCTRRGTSKVPCAVRVLLSGVERVYIGTLDPNPHITGRGETFLSYHLPVERFPWELSEELIRINSEFFEQHRHEHVPAVSLYSSQTSGYDAFGPSVPALLGQREGLLHQTMDLITGDAGDVHVMSGNRLSWLEELQIALLLATLAGRSVKILCSGPEASLPDSFMEMREAAYAVGASLAVAPEPFSIRGTLVQSEANATMVCVEKKPALHGLLLRQPHERGIVESVHRSFMDRWSRASPSPARVPEIRPLTEAELVGALRDGVPAYRKARIALTRVPVDELVPLTLCLQRFKLFRLHQFAALRDQHSIPSEALIKGSPWPLTPPVVEQAPDGTLVVVDGAHRTHSARERAERDITVLLVQDVGVPLPASPILDLSEVRLATEKVSREARYKDYNPEYFRPIRSAFSALARA